MAAPKGTVESIRRGCAGHRHLSAGLVAPRRTPARFSALIAVRPVGQQHGLIADMTAPKDNSHLLGNSAWNASAFLVTVGLNFLVLPFVLFRLGTSVFGVAGLVTACIAPALAFTNALASSTTRELAYRLAAGER